MAETAEILLQNPTVMELLSKPQLVLREKCRRSLWFVTQYFWHAIIPDTLVSNWHMPYICYELQQVVTRAALGKPKLYDLIINIPPGTTKSTMAVQMLPVWAWLRWHWMRFIFGSYSGELALEHAGLCKDIIAHPTFCELFPDFRIRHDRDTKSMFQIQKYNNDFQNWENGGTRAATSVGGTITGKHAHVIGVDDPLNPKQAASETQLDTANYWMGQTLSTRKVDKSATPTILIMQRLHQKDPSGVWLKQEKNEGKRVKWISLPGECREYGDQVHPEELKRYYKDDLLDEKRMTWQVLFDMKAELGQYGYAGQVGQDPTPPGGGMFKVDHFQVLERMTPLVNVIQTVRYWDKAGTEGGTGARTAGVKMHKLKSGKYLISDVKAGRWASEERERIIRETAEADGRSTIIYFEQEPGSGGKESAEATIRNLAGFSAYADRPTGDKVYRADPYSVQVNNGNVLLLQAEWNEGFKEEHRFFPHGTYKDQIDAGSGAFNKLAAKKQARTLMR